MGVTKTQAAAYVGAGAVTATAVAALRHGTSPKVLALGAATGIAAGSVETLVQSKTDASELGWIASIGTGAAGGAALLGGLSKAQGFAPMKAYGIGAGLGAAAGVFAPIVAGTVLAQLD